MSPTPTGTEQVALEEDWARVEQPEQRKRVQNRLSQRRHRAKLRQQRGAISQEIIVPPSFTSSFILDGPGVLMNTESSDNMKQLENHHQDEDLSKVHRGHEDFDAFEGFSAESLLHTDELFNNEIAQWSQTGISGLQCVITPNSGHSSLSSTVQGATDISNGFESSNSPHLGDPGSDYWNNQVLTDLSWNTSSFNPNLASISSPGNAAGTPRLSSNNLSQSRIDSSSLRHKSTTLSDNQAHQTRKLSTQRTPSLASDIHNSTVSQEQITEQCYPILSNSQNFLRIDTTGEAPNVREDKASCTHCHSCGAASRLPSPGRVDIGDRTPQNTPASAMSRSSTSGSSSRTSCADNLDILSSCSTALAKLAHQSTGRMESGRMVSNRKRKSGGGSQGSTPVSNHSQDDEYDDRPCVSGVEKVVIVYVHDGRFKK